MAEQLWAQCDTCSKWRRLPESMRDSDELDEAWTCAMHPDPALRGCEVAEEGLNKDEVTTLVEVQEQGSCGTPGCSLADFHLGPCSNWGTDNGGERKRRRSSSGEGMAAKAAEVKAVKVAKAATKATAKLLQEQEEATAAADEQSGRGAARVSRGGSAAKAKAKAKEEEESDEEEAEQLWAHCDACGKWRRLPESMRDSDELDEAWTCAMHPDPALRGCEVAEEGLNKDEVTTLVEVQEQGSCGTPGCSLADFHLGPCSNCTVSGGRRNRGRHSK